MSQSSHNDHDDNQTADEDDDAVHFCRIVIEDNSQIIDSVNNDEINSNMIVLFPKYILHAFLLITIYGMDAYKMMGVQTLN